MRMDSDGYKYDYDLFDMEYFTKIGDFLTAVIAEEDEKELYYLIGVNPSKLTK